jgi:rhamnulokinase
MRKRIHLAIDIGAESGRVIAGIWNDRRIRLEEVHRFPNGGVLLNESLRWDVVRLWGEIQAGLGLAAAKYGKSIVSVGADTWGVDYVLLDREGEMLGQPYCYRDGRTDQIMRKAFRRVPRAELFRQGGLQFMQFNTLFQLLAHREQARGTLEAAHRFLLMPDFIHWCLCGSEVVEFTNATTTQMVHPTRRTWNKTLLNQFKLPTRMLPKIVQPGTRLGKLRSSVAAHTGLGRIQVVAPPTHDTASAVAGVPTKQTGLSNWAYISSGTWSLMGVEIRKASLTPRTLDYNLTNEGGLDGTYQLLKNIMGLWLVQRCKRSFDAAGRVHSYSELERLASKARPLRSILNPNDARFLHPEDMPRAIQEFCRETNQPVPRTVGEIVRCARESLALMYREVLGGLEELTRTRIEVIHIVGGGSKDDLLNQMAADACQRPVLAGPVEATALGNLMTQVRTSGGVKSLAEMREVIRRSSQLKRYTPGAEAVWEAAVSRFKQLRRRRRAPR